MSTEKTIRPENLDSTVRATNPDGTVRPPHFDGTVRPANPDGTVRPANLDGTVRPANLDGTVRVTSSVSTSLGMDGTVRADKQAIQQDNVNDDSFLLKGVKYRNIQFLSDNSGEAQVFLVEKDGEE